MNCNYTDIEYKEFCWSCRKEFICRYIFDGINDWKLFEIINIIVLLISGLSLLIVGFFIYFNKKFKLLPHPFIAIACILESFFYF